MRNKLVAVAAVVTAALTLAGCAGTGGSGSGAAGDGVTLEVAANEGGYGRDMYNEVIAAYQAVNPGVKVNLKISKTIAEEITPQVASGKFPDVVVLGQGGKAGFTDAFVRDRGVEDLTDVLERTVPGEQQTVGAKLTEGIVGNLSTNPYGDDRTYLMPLFASPTGLAYNRGLFEAKGWKVPTTWDEFFALGETAKKEGISLFTYPTAGYLDSYFYGLLATIGGEEFYRDVMTYQPDAWKTPQARQALDITTRLLTQYTSPETVGYANDQDYTKNQQSILENTTLFMPNGAWIDKEMEAAPRAAGFSWGLMPVPAVAPGAERYLTTLVESAWIPAKSDADNKDAAKDFIAFLYSDTAADIFAKSDAVQPITGLSGRLTGAAKQFYAEYDSPGVKPLVGAFATVPPVPGVDIKTALYDAANGVIGGSTTEDTWQNAVNDASNKLGQANP